MRTWSCFALVGAAIVVIAGTAEAQDAVVRARQLYNEHHYDAAIQAAQDARRRPELADAAGVVLARSYIERYRQTATAADLAAARDLLSQIDPKRLVLRDRGEWTTGLGEWLYLDGKFGAAAETFDAALAYAGATDAGTRDRVLGWWALAVDHQARGADDTQRRRLYRRILERMEAVLRSSPESGAAPYWLVVAAAGVGDFDRAWDAAISAWLRAPATGVQAASLRDDLDRIVQQLLVPERARRGPASDIPKRTLAVRAEWDAVKQAWPQK